MKFINYYFKTFKWLLVCLLLIALGCMFMDMNAFEVGLWLTTVALTFLLSLAIGVVAYRNKWP